MTGCCFEIVFKSVLAEKSGQAGNSGEEFRCCSFFRSHSRASSFISRGSDITIIFRQTFRVSDKFNSGSVQPPRREAKLSMVRSEQFVLDLQIISDFIQIKWKVPSCHGSFNMQHIRSTGIWSDQMGRRHHARRCSENLRGHPLFTSASVLLFTFSHNSAYKLQIRALP